MKIQSYNLLFLIFSSITIAFCADDNKLILKDSNIIDIILKKMVRARQSQRDSLIDLTVNKNDICEIHHCKMAKDTVPNVICGDAGIDEILSMKPDRHPHGYKYVCANAFVTRAIIYICPKCINVFEAECDKNDKESVESIKSK